MAATREVLLWSVLLFCCGFFMVEAIPWSLGNVLMTGISAGIEFTDNMAVGQRLAHEHCQRQFFWHRWNCPQEQFLQRNHQPGRATREAAVIDALTAAAIAHSLTRNCTSGQIPGCTCNNQPPGRTARSGGRAARSGASWQWGGCSDNIEFGEQMSQQFLDHIPLNMPLNRAVVRLHNNQAGRQVVRRSLRRICKCHGVSGSCTTETCWSQIGDFTDTAARISRKYRKAKRLSTDGSGNSVNPATTVNFDGVKPLDLVYLDDSPDLCRRQSRSGHGGTRGRECSRARGADVTRAEKRSCKTLCRTCGRKVRRTKIEVKSSCNCRFHWCCHVTCDTCVQQSYKYTCR